MKSYFGLIKKYQHYAISSTSDEAVWYSASILVEKMMRNCHADEVPTHIVSLDTHCNKGFQSNQKGYLCR